MEGDKGNRLANITAGLVAERRRDTIAGDQHRMVARVSINIAACCLLLVALFRVVLR